MTALRNYDVCMALRRFDELHVHGPDRREVLFDDGFHRAIALGNIASQPAYESNIVRRIDEYLDIHLLQQTRVGEVLHHLLEVVRTLARVLAPFMPDTAAELRALLGINASVLSAPWGKAFRAGHNVNPPKVLFPRIETDISK